ncbi:MAG: SRPBCC domain-containing protein [Dongiaceae bacterium]
MARTKPKPAKTADRTKRELVLTRVFDAPREKVFGAWTDPAKLACWLGPKGYTVPHCEMDVRPGGAWRTCICSPKGTDHWVQGRYREVVAPERLVFTWAWEDEHGKPGHETVVAVDFRARGDKTELTLTHSVFESAKSRDAHKSGWSSSLDCLAEYLA